METLNNEQYTIAQKALEGGDMFITGSAGVGKSYLLKVLVNQLNNKWPKKNSVAVTALTGIAAVSIDGITLHSFAGMGHDLSKPISFKALYKWKAARVLIVDEVSMMTDKFLEKLYPPLCEYNIQIILFGDFLQLPPVNGIPCFMSPLWEKMNLKNHTYQLKTVIRQNDREFIQVLNEIRMGDISPESIKFLEKLDIKNFKKITKDTTKLYTMNNGVDGENYKRLVKIKSEFIQIKAIDTITKGKKSFPTTHSPPGAPYLIKKIDNLAPQLIKIKINSQVILTRNRSDGLLVNGSRGVVKEINNGIPMVDFKNSLVLSIEPIEYEVEENGYKFKRMQIPLKFAWALTCHKAQGLTLPKVLVSLKGAFAQGQIYTALSRATCPEGLIINNVKTLVNRNTVCPMAKEYYRGLTN